MICNEAELAQRASGHDPLAFAELYNAYVDKIYKYVYYKVGNAQDAEDLCEQVFLKAWEAIGRYTWCGYPFSSWLYRLAHNLVVDHYRTRRDTTPLSSIIATSAEPADPRNAFLQTLDADELLGAINRLTAEQQQVIALKFVEGYDNSEIALLLNKKESAIRALQYRALHSLQNILAAEDERNIEFALGALSN
ncbi:MAG: sigma-70 family RNA polymerase sigma factor [Chloroflexota bacterium]